MSLLTVAQDVCDMIGIARPAAIVSSNEALSRQILGLAKETLEELCLMDWPGLEVPYTFNTVVSQAQYALPADFFREAGDSVFVASQYGSLRGSLTAADWQRQRSGLQPNIGRYKFRIFGLPKLLNLVPTPTVVEAIIMEYQTSYRVRQADLTYKTTFFADTDTSIVQEELLKKGLKWRLRRAKGLDYSEEFDDYEMTRNQRLAQELGMGSMPVAYRTYDDDGLGSPFVRETGFGT